MTRICNRCGVAFTGHEEGDSECPACMLRLGLMGPAAPATPGRQGPGPGDRVGEWVLQRLLRRGPQATVFLATDASGSRTVVIKWLSPSLVQDEVAHHRFLLEASRRIDHPNVVPVLDSGSHGDTPYLVIPFYAGGSLADWVDTTWGPPSGSDRPALRPDLDFQQIARWGLEVAQAVGCLHEQGIIHRDLKPSNLLLDDDQQVRVGDFGISGSVASDQRITPTGWVLGSPGYMAPEWVSGQVTGGTVTADIYGIGAILMTLLTGQPPYTGPNALAALREASEVPVSTPRSRNPSVPRDLNTICARCLSRDPGRRYRSARDLEDDLDRFLHGDAPRAPAPTAFGQLIDWARCNRFTAGMLGTTAVAAVVVAAISLSALARVSAARDESRRLAEDRRRTVVRLWTEKGIDSMARHRPGEAMAWFGAAWQSEILAGTSNTTAVHSLSLEACLSEFLEPIQVVALPTDATHVWASESGSNLVAIAERGRISRWLATDVRPQVDETDLEHAFLGFFPQAGELYLHARGASNRNHLMWIDGNPKHPPGSMAISGQLRDVVSSPDRQWLALAVDGVRPQTEVWRASPPERIASFHDHSDRIRRVCWVGTNRFATASWDGSVVLRAWPGDRVLATWRTSEYVRDLTVDPLGRWLAFGGDDRLLHLVDLRSLRETFTIACPAWAMRLAAADDGSRIAVGDRGGNVSVWDPLTGQPLLKWTRFSDSEIRRLVFNPGNSRLAFATADQTLRIISVDASASVLATLPVADERGGCDWLSPDRLLSVPFPGVGVVWKIPSFNRFQNFRETSTDASRLQVSADRRWIAVADDEATRIFSGLNPETSPTIVPHTGPVADLGFEERSARFHLLAQSGRPMTIALPEGRRQELPEIPNGPDIAAALLEPSGNQWIVLNEDGRLVTRPAREGAGFDAGPNAPGSHSRRLRAPPFERKFITSPDQRSFLLTLSPQYRVAPDIDRISGLWLGRFPFRNGTEIALEFPGNCSSAAFSMDGRWIAAGSWDGAYRIFNAADGSPATPLRRQTTPIRSVTLDRSGRVLITGSTDRHIRFWDLQSGDKVAPDIEMQASVAHVQITPSGNLLGLGNDGSVALWSADDWRPIFLKTSADAPLRRFAVSPDGRMLVMTTKDRTLTTLNLDPSPWTPADARRWIDLLAPYRITASGTHQAITPTERLEAWHSWGGRPPQ